jgi:site-specific DNA recombinase
LIGRKGPRYRSIGRVIKVTKNQLGGIANGHLVNIPQKEKTKARRDFLEAFMVSLESYDGLITEFDELLWYALVDFATVFTQDDVRFIFKDGTEVQA